MPIVLLAEIVLVACRSFYPAMLQAVADPPSTRLLPVTLTVTNEPVVAGVTYVSDPLQGVSHLTVDTAAYPRARLAETEVLIREEFARNVVAAPDSGLAYGVISVSVRRTAKAELGRWLIPSAATAFTLNLLGFPVAAQRAEIGLRLRIHDAGGRLVREFQVTGAGRSYGAFYWGNSLFGMGAPEMDTPASAVANARATRHAVRLLKAELRQDLVEINARLRSAR